MGNLSKNLFIYLKKYYLKNIIKNQSYVLCLSQIRGWQKIELDGLLIYYSGQKNAIDIILKVLAQNSNWKLRLNETLKKTSGYYSLIIIDDDNITAVTDTIRSYPLYYSIKNNIITLGDDAVEIKKNCDLNDDDNVAALEASMSGYCAGTKTLYSGLKQLLSGSVLKWTFNDSKLMVERYYMYLPEVFHDDIEKNHLKNIETVFDNIFDRTINNLNGRTAVVPLSGGLDSRLVLSKLVEKKYKNIVAFSYGLVGNPECERAKIIARKLDVPWHFIKINRRLAKEFYSSSVYKEYCDYAEGLSCVPNIQDVHALYILLKKNIINNDAVIINGQSGDFITGGHIPLALSTSNYSEDRVLKRIIEKHYSLWTNLMTFENIEIIKNEIKKSLKYYFDILDGSSYQNDAAIYEMWEYEERQTKYVINGQRTYEHYGLDWDLPLWDIELIEFYKNMPYRHKINQSLYKTYLKKWNYKNIFDVEEKIMPPYNTTLALVITPVIVVLKYIIGNENRIKVARSLEYTGRFGHLYSAYSFKEYVFSLKYIRNAASLFVKDWLSSKNMFAGTDKTK